MTRIDVGDLIFGKENLVLAETMNIMSDSDIGPDLNPDSDINSDIDPDIDPEQKPSLTSIPTYTPSIIPNIAAPKPNSTPTPALPATPTPIDTTPIDTTPNVMNIDFNALAQKETDDTIRTLHKYFASVTPTNKNEYTGKFKGYNLIMITAEGFSPYAINKDKTPTLYRLVREGFVFNNFYTALWQTSTSDGEYVDMTGLIPVGTRSMYHGRTNYWPFALGNQFNLLGVKSKAYHNHTYTYYQRNETHPNLGYDFVAKGNGLVLEHPNAWPASDLELINASVNEYINEEQFHVYYLTVSGHMNYTFEGNSMSYKNRDLVKDLPYSSDARAYIACQMELDKALEQLLAKLEEAGVADRTVIALSADHYPYGWEKEKLDELAGHVVDPNFEIYRNQFILWNAGMEESIVIDEPCSSLDILPTLSNLFGLEYDSRLLMGQDILSDAAPLVLLSNHSFITNKVMYNSETGETTLLAQEALPKNYISNMNKVVKNKFIVSQSILDKDYYRYVFPEGTK
jgi:phosphoglycerol transferase MdoB-like AlkP superfamily enzyme